MHILRYQFIKLDTEEILDLNYPERFKKITTCFNIRNLKGLPTLGWVLIVKYPYPDLYINCPYYPTLAHIARIKSKIECINLNGTIMETKLKAN